MATLGKRFFNPKNELPRGITNIVVSEQGRHKPTYKSTEAG